MSCATTIPSRVLRQASEAAAHKDAATKLEKERAVLRERTEVLTQRCEALEARASTAEAARAEAAEALTVAHAERRLVNESLGRADSMVGELRAERAALTTRLAEAETLCHKLQQQRTAAEEARAGLQEKLAVMTAERRLLDESLERALLQVNELKVAAVQQKQATEARADELEAARDEARASRAELQEGLSVAQAERRLLDEARARDASQASSEQEALRTQLAAAEARSGEGRTDKDKGDEERAQLQKALAVAHAEKRLLQDLLERVQQLQFDERAANQVARDRTEATHGELAARLEAAEAAARGSAERLKSLEAERKGWSERQAHVDGYAAPRLDSGQAGARAGSSGNGTHSTTGPAQHHWPCTAPQALHSTTGPAQHHWPCTAPLAQHSTTGPPQHHWPSTAPQALHSTTGPAQHHWPCPCSRPRPLSLFAARLSTTGAASSCICRASTKRCSPSDGSLRTLIACRMPSCNGCSSSARRRTSWRNALETCRPSVTPQSRSAPSFRKR